MSKRPKLAYGIFEDGTTLRMVSLKRDLYHVTLQGIERIEMDKPLYQTQAELTEFERQSWEENNGDSKNIQLDDFDSRYLNDFKLSPWDRMFAAFDLRQGVIALNVNDENLTRGSEIPGGRNYQKNFASTSLSPAQYKSGRWQTSIVQVGETRQIWLHNGENRLLELLQAYSQRNKRNLYYQLVDANDIALADYFRINHLNTDQRVVLLYLGRDYRKALLFEKYAWTAALPLSITQDLPEPELIYSRLSFALDSNQQLDPAQIVICGDLASEALVNYINAQGSSQARLLDFNHLNVENRKNEILDDSYLCQFTLPIALAYKALFPDETRFTPSNFLPKQIIEAQKPFKIAWHGWLTLMVIFGLTLLGTLFMLNSGLKYKKLVAEKRQLEFQLTTKQIEAAEITKMKEEIENFQKNLDSVRVLLQGKNPWSAVLDTLNKLFRIKPVSWLSSFKKEGDRLAINGYTTNRRNILDFAEALPNSRIRKVTSSQVRNTTLWSFDIISDLPEVDWVGQIEKEIAEFMEQNAAAEAEATAAAALAEAQTQVPASKQDTQKPAEDIQKPAEATRKAPEPVQTETVWVSLSPIPTQYMPQLTKWQSKASSAELAAYNEIVSALNRESRDEYFPLGQAFLKNYPRGRLRSLVRWHLAYRLYKAGDYHNAVAFLDPLVHEVSLIYPHALLLSARIDYARHNKRYAKTYKALTANYPDHPIQEMVKADLDQIARGGAL